MSIHACNAAALVTRPRQQQSTQESQPRGEMLGDPAGGRWVDANSGEVISASSEDDDGFATSGSGEGMGYEIIVDLDPLRDVQPTLATPLVSRESTEADTLVSPHNPHRWSLPARDGPGHEERASLDLATSAAAVTATATAAPTEHPPFGVEGDYLEVYRAWRGIFSMLADGVSVDVSVLLPATITVFGAGLDVIDLPANDRGGRKKSIRDLRILATSFCRDVNALFGRIRDVVSLLQHKLGEIAAAVRVEHEIRGSIVARAVMRIRQTLECELSPGVSCEPLDICVHGEVSIACVRKLAAHIATARKMICDLSERGGILQHHPVYGLRWSPLARAYNSALAARPSAPGVAGQITTAHLAVQDALREIDMVALRVNGLAADISQFSGKHRDYRMAEYTTRVTSGAYQRQLMGVEFAPR